MPHSLNKSIEARKLNPRTMTVLPGPETTVSFGALVDHIERDRDMATFRYLGEPYTCPYERLASALDQAHTAEAAPAIPATPKPAAPDVPRLLWQELPSNGPALKRAKVPGGWLVLANGAMAFYPDAEHLWDGTSLPE